MSWERTHARSTPRQLGADNENNENNDKRGDLLRSNPALRPSKLGAWVLFDRAERRKFRVERCTKRLAGNAVEEETAAERT